MPPQRGKVDHLKVPFLPELPIPAQCVKGPVAALAQFHDKHIVFRDPLAVDVNDVVNLFGRCAANADVLKAIPISADCGARHANFANASPSRSVATRARKCQRSASPSAIVIMVART